MRMIDMTLPLRDGMAGYPGDPPIRIRQIRDLAEHGFRLHELRLGSHAGTHVNAPWHMAPGGERLEDLPLTHFVARAVVRSPSSPVRPDFAEEGGAGLAADVMIARSSGGFQAHAPIPTGLGLVYADAPLDARELPLVLAARPPFVAQAAQFPLDEDVERALCRAGIVSFENLANTGELPRDETFLFVGLPLAIEGDGAPVRAIAVLMEPDFFGHP
jgi:kynurenine formamidase